MPPKVDPYATKSARAVDLFLILLALLAVALLLLTAPRHHSIIGAMGIQPISTQLLTVGNSPRKQ